MAIFYNKLKYRVIIHTLCHIGILLHAAYDIQRIDEF